MEVKTKEKLIGLMEECARAGVDSEVPDSTRETIVDVVSRLINFDASEQQVADNLVGSLRAIYDASCPGDDDPIVKRIAELVDR